MDNNGEIESLDDNEVPSSQGRRGRQYSPVFAHDNDRAVVEMSSLDPGSSSPTSNHDNSLKKIKVNRQPNVGPELGEESLPTHVAANGPQRESKLELFGFDSLVNILGLKSMTGEQIPAPSSPRDGEDVSIILERPKATGVKLGTMMGVFVPCLQNILGIIYYIRFTW